MLPKIVFAQMMNNFIEQCFCDHDMDQEHGFMCKNETGVIEVRHVE